MKIRRSQSALRVGVALTLAIGLLLLLIAQAPAHHNLVLAGFLSLPILFLGLVEIPSTLGRLDGPNSFFPNQVLSDSPRFQRPPPVALP